MLSGYVASGPLVLLLEVVQRMGPQPSAGQVYTLFALSAAGTLAGADWWDTVTQAMQPVLPQVGLHQGLCMRVCDAFDDRARFPCACGRMLG